MNKVKTVLLSTLMMAGLVAAPAAFGAVSYAATEENVKSACQGVAKIGGGNACREDSEAGNQLTNLIQDVINILLFLVGAVAVIMIIVGGFRYVLSGGDSSQTTAAKNTILYAVIGLVVAVMAYAIVNFVLNGLLQN